MFLHAIKIPKEIKRVFIFANTPGVRVSKLGLREGDMCVHINKARYAKKTKGIEGVYNALMVRWRYMADGGIEWCGPDDMNNYNQITFWGNNMFNYPAWLQAYGMNNPGKYPTTGFVAYNCVHDEAPNIPTFLVGFKPWADVGTKWEGHAWTYESVFYMKNKVVTI